MKINESLKNCLPPKVLQKVQDYPSLNEIRIRKNCPLCITQGNANLTTDCITGQEDIEYCVTRLCKNSVYAYFEFIKKGYIPFDSGCRVGVCGKAVTEKDSIINITEIWGLNIRLPTDDPAFPEDFLKHLPYSKGFLVFSPPNTGKTTLLKKAAVVSACPPYNKKTAVIDSNEELYSEKMHKGLPIDFYRGYPKYDAMDMAVRTMSPEIIICDEIGVKDSPAPFTECKNSGIALICSTHAGSLKELMARKNIISLHEAEVFEGYAGIFCKNGKRTYEYISRKEISY